VLYKSGVVGVGVLDMLRFHKFTIGWGWVSDYGSPDNPEELKALRAYSPYHNIKPGTAYPATFITTTTGWCRRTAQVRCRAPEGAGRARAGADPHRDPCRPLAAAGSPPRSPGGGQRGVRRVTVA
jgi:prolyl oligopeptidase